MRPLKLELEGFTAFRAPTCLDLADLDLFAITGPTGAGKSSLIDAISYALYGQVPRVGDDVGDCISQGMERMRVVLEFMAGEERYRVYRETRRKGQPNARLDRMEEGQWIALADRSRDVTAAVVRAVGLDYNAFTRSVLLPQGQFQEFLAGSADKRRAVLRSLLRLDVYERMRGRATSLAAELKTRLDERERELAALAEATPESLRRIEQELGERRDEATRLQAAARTLADGLELAATLTQARERLRAAQGEAEALRADLNATQDLVAEGDEQLAALEQAAADAEARLAANCFDPERLAALTLALGRARDLIRCLEDLARAEAARAGAEARIAQLGAATEERKRRHASAEAELAAADAARREAELHDLAAALQRGLRPGDVCPVCGGVVGELPAVAGDGLAAAQARYEAARTAEAKERGALQSAVEAAVRAAAEREAAGGRCDDLSRQHHALASELAEALPAEADVSIAALDAALQQQTAARAERQGLEDEVRKTTAGRERLRGEVDAARWKLSALSQRAEAAAKARDAALAAVSEAADHLAALAQKVGWPEVVDGLRVDADVAPGLRSRLESTHARQQENALLIGQTEERLKRLLADLERAKSLRHDLEDVKQEHGVAADLAQVLMANRFQAFVQQEALATLAADGSRRLEQLSAGRYRLGVDTKGQDFVVVDQWNADEPRPVKTLSGGETFLASLALSLALAESLPGLAASRRVVLDSIFLDEGFGSLDAEALDRAADALDALRGENRLVCVVTHLQELAQRLPARVVVSKSESGSTVSVA